MYCGFTVSVRSVSRFPPAAEIDHVSSLFQEKQAELQSAVVRVDQVTVGFRPRSAFVDLLHNLIFPPADPAVGGLEERTPSATLRPGNANRVSGWTHRTERISPLWSCSPGAEEALPGAAGEIDALFSLTCEHTRVL